MHIIKNAILFSAVLPSAHELNKELGALRFSPITPIQAVSYGFTETDISPDLVVPFEGGFSVTLRIDEKILPPGVVKRAKQEAVRAAEAEAGHKLARHQIEDIHADVLANLISVALVKTTMVRAFYYEADNLLIVATSAQRNASTLMALIIKACESVKTSTIHVDGVRFGLTAHLRNHLNGEPKDFGQFNIGDSAVLKGEAGKLVVDLDNLDSAREGLIEAIGSGMQIDKLALEHGTMGFVLSSDFRMSRVHFFGEEDGAAEDVESLEEMWARQAHIEVTQIAAAVRELCRIFSRQTDMETDVELAAENSQDPLYPQAVELVINNDRATITFLQRALRIGYNRAARLIESMEADGLVSVPDATGNRTILSARIATEPTPCPPENETTP